MTNKPAFNLSLLNFRSNVQSADLKQVIEIVRSTGFFSEEEIAISGELVEHALQFPGSDDYLFIFAEHNDCLCAYSCYGRIPLTRSSFDIYWIAVRSELRGSGIGRQLLRRTEEGIVTSGGTQAYLDTSGRAQYQPTRRFYEAAGYLPEATLKDFYAPGDDKIIYKKLLKV